MLGIRPCREEMPAQQGITRPVGGALLSGERPETSAVGLVLSVLSLVMVPALAYAKQRTGHQLGSRALVADSVETWVWS
jgi:divalent metal cation (Fe/Co/Zn/Cd) transporter